MILKLVSMSDARRDFWNRVARRYSAMPMRNPMAYEATLARVRTYLKPAHSVLELGCGSGTTALRLAPHVRRYTASDRAAEMISVAREKCAAAGIEGLDLCTAGCGDDTLPDGPFDVVLAFNLLHLLPDRHAALGDVHDMLPDQGLFITKTPCLGGVFSVFRPLVALLRWAGKAPDIRFLTPERLEHDITSAGFEILESDDHPKRPPSRFIVARKL